MSRSLNHTYIHTTLQTYIQQAMYTSVFIRMYTHGEKKQEFMSSPMCMYMHLRTHKFTRLLHTYSAQTVEQANISHNLVGQLLIISPTRYPRTENALRYAHVYACVLHTFMYMNTAFMTRTTGLCA